MRDRDMTSETNCPNAAKHLRDVENQEALIQEAFESGDPRHIAHALGIIARARGMTEVSRNAGVSRLASYKALSGGGDTRISTMTGGCAALGIKISARSAPRTPAA